MAEALALGASIVAFIQLADRIISLTKNVADSTTLRMATTETSALKDVLIELEKTHAATGLTAIIDAAQKPLENCQASMEQLEAELEKLSLSRGVPTAPGKKQRVKQAVRWVAGGEERVKKLVATLVAEKATLSLALLADISEDVKIVKLATAGVNQHLDDRQSAEVTRWLVHTNPTDIHNRSIKLYEERTGEWMLKSQEWKTYIGGSTRSLWIHGIPGAGKTILMSHLIDSIDDHTRNASLFYSYYYCYFGRNQDESEPFLRWIISQLCAQIGHKHIPPKLQDLHKRQQHPSYANSLEILAHILQHTGKTYVAIDAVDESKPYTGLLQLLVTLMTESRFTNLRLLISSREHLDIEEALKPHAVSVSMSNEAVQEDIRIFVSATLRSSPKFQSWPPSLYKETAIALAKGAKGMFRWAICQIDILGRLKSQSAVRKALGELPETLDATYERILKAIPTEHREFAHATLSILAAQSELGEPEAQMSPRILLSMVLRTLGLDISTDHFYSIFDVRETCGCLVTFTPYQSHARYGREVVLLAHYTVKEFLFDERTSRSLNTVVQKFALDKDAIVTKWAQTVLDIAIAARPTEDPVTSDSIDDYCQAVADLIIKEWHDELPILGLGSQCLQLLSPSGAHHSRRKDISLLFLAWESAPANPITGALAECFWRKFWRLAREAICLVDLVDAREVLETTLRWTFDLGREVAHRTDECREKETQREKGRKECAMMWTETWPGWPCECPLKMLQVPVETSLVLSIFLEKYQKQPTTRQLNFLAKYVGPDALLFAILAKPDNNDWRAKPLLMEKMLELGADANSTACQLTPLQLAALLWDVGGVKFLLSAGADVNKVGSAQGFRVAGTGIDYDDLRGDSPLRILRTRQFTPPRPSIQLTRAGTGAVVKAEIEALLGGAGAKDFRRLDV
ncbi:hypothetical protein QBC47DRAFT_412452 [Echria macrotheca]|uniref:NACHT domain-containing protein n=1 Tax=Echria macrotheca TaxID=438768 RepID=A0AAJ0BF64_9PEZI|nr:hypothetical protein QBC47DRAFT_412452 [Echria macrotheca]